jgi:hypothetical protein
MNKNKSKKLSKFEFFAKRFSEQHIKDVFDCYNSQKSGKEQNRFLNSLVIAVTNDQNID